MLNFLIIKENSVDKKSKFISFKQRELLVGGKED